MTMITKAPSSVPRELCRAAGNAISSVTLSGAMAAIQVAHTFEAALRLMPPTDSSSRVANRKTLTHNKPPVMLYSVMRVLIFMPHAPALQYRLTLATGGHGLLVAGEPPG